MARFVLDRSFLEFNSPGNVPPWVTILFWAFALLCTVAAIYSLYGVYYAFIKTKDERQKQIVVNALAHAFLVVLGVTFVQMLLDYFGILNLRGVFAGYPFAWVMVALGVSLFINKRRFGGDGGAYE